MLDNKTITDIMLEEKIAKIDDINFDKIYDVDEFATKQLEDFENVDFSSNEHAKKEDDASYELELRPNEFLDNMVWGEDEEIEQINAKKGFKLANKPLFYAVTSIAFLLCILFIYNVFVIKSLESSLYSSASSQGNGAVNATFVEETNTITFDNSATLEIQENASYLPNNKNVTNQTNWFNEVCSNLNQLFGGNY